jgi:hypothetical protein
MVVHAPQITVMQMVVAVTAELAQTLTADKEKTVSMVPARIRVWVDIER